MIELLIQKGALINAPWEEYKYTPLHLAALAGNFEVASSLLKHGADASLLDANGFKPWELTERVEIVDMMVTPQEKLRWYARDLWYGQYYHVNMGEVDAFLSQSESEIDYVYNGKTLFMLSLESVNLEWMAMLLKHGCKVGTTNLEYAENHGYPSGSKEQKMCHSLLVRLVKDTTTIAQLQSKQ